MLTQLSACTYEGWSRTSKSRYGLLSLTSVTGPSFKRGPPKGYIQAIERRWHQVESILGVIMAAPQARDMVSTLRKDAMAREILDRVNAGPYVSTCCPFLLVPSSEKDIRARAGDRVDRQVHLPKTSMRPL